MSFFDILSLAGGLAMFLYGMRLMGDALKESSSGALKVAMEHVTNNPIKAFLLGVAITAVIQSSTATIVITSGLVAAGILTLHQSLGIIVGANVGTTVTGQIIRLLDVEASSGSILQLFQPSTLAPLALIIGIILIMSGKFKNGQSVGNILIGFGILFSGLLNMTAAVSALGESDIVKNLFVSLGNNPLIGYITGAGVAFVLQSSSATIGILQAFSASGQLIFSGIYAVIVGVYLGDCVTTAIVCSIGAEPEARRVGIINILFNLGKTVLSLAAVTIAHRAGLLDWIWNEPVNSGIIANTNTVFNLACALILLPGIGTLERLSHKIVKDQKVATGKYQDKLDALNPVFFDTPALALRSCYDALLTSFTAARANIVRSRDLIDKYDASLHQEVTEEENRVDQLTDHVSRYMIQLLPHLKDLYHVSILDQYYKVNGEFEHLGDNADHIAGIAKLLNQDQTHFSEEARNELQVLYELTGQILDLAGEAFKKRNVEAAYDIEPLVQVSGDLINKIRMNHLKRMSTGVCDPLADTSFTNLLAEIKRIAGICSNIGTATVVRVRPELADREHYYYESLHSGKDEKFNESYKTAWETYAGKLSEIA